MEVALQLSNAARKTSQMDHVVVGRKIRPVQTTAPPPHNHFTSLYYSLYYKKCEYIHHNVYVLGKCEVILLLKTGIILRERSDESTPKQCCLKLV